LISLIHTKTTDLQSEVRSNEIVDLV